MNHIASAEDKCFKIEIERALFRYLDHNGVDPMKYHETLTRAWIMAVRHFMEICSDSESADSFLDKKPRLLDSKIMLKHYSADLLFSRRARHRFVEPDPPRSKRVADLGHHDRG